MMKRHWIIIALLFLALPMIAQNRQPQVVDKVVGAMAKSAYEDKLKALL